MNWGLFWTSLMVRSTGTKLDFGKISKNGTTEYGAGMEVR